jgi:hypothetical protein
MKDGERGGISLCAFFMAQLRSGMHYVHITQEKGTSLADINLQEDKEVPFSWFSLSFLDKLFNIFLMCIVYGG